MVPFVDARYHHKDVHVRIFIWRSVREGAKKDDAFRLEFSRNRLAPIIDFSMANHAYDSKTLTKCNGVGNAPLRHT